MRTTTIASFIAAGVFAASSHALDNRSAGPDKVQWLPIPAVHARLESAGYRNIEKIERERGSYEVKATDRSGRRMKLYVHSQTGEIIEQRPRDSRRNDDRTASDGRRNFADCNERRCRDDLPPPGAAVSATRK